MIENSFEMYGPVTSRAVTNSKPSQSKLLMLTLHLYQLHSPQINGAGFHRENLALPKIHLQ